MKRALFAGTFNPFTVGHADIVSRGLELFDEVVIGIGDNQDKEDSDAHKREQAIRQLYADNSRVRVVVYHSLTVDCAKDIGADFLLRGIRSTADFEYERQIADANRSLAGIETVLLFTRPELAFVSSTFVRDLQHHDANAAPYLPK